jgi:hypothetical protein
MSVAAAWLLGATATAATPPWSLSWSPRVDAERRVGSETVRPVRQTSVLARRFGTESRALLQHEFRDLDLPPVDGTKSDTNSFVHRLTLAWQLRGDALRLDVGATLAVSSNALKNADDLEFGDLQPALGAQWRAGPAWLALYADDRLGRTLVYPGFEVPLHPAPDHAVSLGFPVSTWRWDAAPSWQSVLAVEPDGACWHVRDEAVERRTEVCSRAWQTRFALRWQPARWFEATASFGWRFDSSLEYTLRDGRAVEVDVPAGPFYGASVGARF